MDEGDQGGWAKGGRERETLFYKESSKKRVNQRAYVTRM